MDLHNQIQVLQFQFGIVKCCFFIEQQARPVTLIRIHPSFRSEYIYIFFTGNVSMLASCFRYEQSWDTHGVYKQELAISTCCGNPSCMTSDRWQDLSSQSTSSDCQHLPRCTKRSWKTCSKVGNGPVDWRSTRPERKRSASLPEPI